MRRLEDFHGQWYWFIYDPETGRKIPLGPYDPKEEARLTEKRIAEAVKKREEERKDRISDGLFKVAVAVGFVALVALLICGGIEKLF